MSKYGRPSENIAATIFQTASIKMVHIRCRQNDACIKIDMGFWQKHTVLLKKALIKDGLIFRHLSKTELLYIDFLS